MKQIASWLGVVAALVLSAGCRHASDQEASVTTKYDPQSGRLVQVTLNARKDGKPNVFSYMDGSSFTRIELDKDEDGKIDRWEYYGADQKLSKVGISRLNDGKVDAWIFAGADGVVDRIEVSTRRNGVTNRTEYYSSGQITRAEEDTNADGRVDKWETYADDALATVSFDTTNSGKPTMTLDYRREGGRPEPLNQTPPR
jgi:hypothetical protein